MPGWLHGRPHDLRRPRPPCHVPGRGLATRACAAACKRRCSARPTVPPCSRPAMAAPDHMDSPVEPGAPAQRPYPTLPLGAPAGSARRWPLRCARRTACRPACPPSRRSGRPGAASAAPCASAATACCPRTCGRAGRAALSGRGRRRRPCGPPRERSYQAARSRSHCTHELVKLMVTTGRPSAAEARRGRHGHEARPGGCAPVVDHVAHVHGAVVERVRGRLGQEVQRARHLLHQHEARQRAAARLGHARHAPARRRAAVQRSAPGGVSRMPTAARVLDASLSTVAASRRSSAGAHKAPRMSAPTELPPMCSCLLLAQ